MDKADGFTRSAASSAKRARFYATAGCDATRQYLNEIGASQLLTAEEEVSIARRMICGRIGRLLPPAPTSLQHSVGPSVTLSGCLCCTIEPQFVRIRPTKATVASIRCRPGARLNRPGVRRKPPSTRCWISGSSHWAKDSVPCWNAASACMAIRDRRWRKSAGSLV